jgi:hypothetical protein
MNLDVTFFAIVAGLLAGYSVIAGLVGCELLHAPTDPHDAPTAGTLRAVTRHISSRERV